LDKVVQILLELQVKLYYILYILLSSKIIAFKMHTIW